MSIMADGCKVFVGNVNENVPKAELRAEFEKFGQGRIY
jgi:RNA recognition motif-containing protein